MARGITDATTCLETSDMAGHYLGGSVLALACVSMLFRMLMTAAGFKSH
jgi:hypothetical protein